MQEGDRADFEGVLVPEKNYRWYQGEIESCGYLRKSELTCVAENKADAMDDLFLTIGFSFAVGFGLGFVLFHDH